MTDDSDLRATAYREAGRAIVAWSLGLEVQSIGISADDKGAGADIGTADHLPLIDQIALTVAGHETEHVFDSPANGGANFDDLRKLIELLRPVPERQSAMLRSQGRDRARQRLVAHWAKVIRLAECLVDVHHVEAAEFKRLIS
jgi:hypothetical protein